jgi:hypothetical protein
VGQKLGQVLAAAPRKITLDFDLAKASGRTPTRDPGDETIACEVTKDASALLVAVEPK